MAGPPVVSCARLYPAAAAGRPRGSAFAATSNSGFPRAGRNAVEFGARPLQQLPQVAVHGDGDPLQSAYGRALVAAQDAVQAETADAGGQREVGLADVVHPGWRSSLVASFAMGGAGIIGHGARSGAHAVPN